MNTLTDWGKEIRRGVSNEIFKRFIIYVNGVSENFNKNVIVIEFCWQGVSSSFE